MILKTSFPLFFYLFTQAATSTLPEYTTRHFLREPFGFGPGVQQFRQTLNGSGIVSDDLEFSVSFWATFRSPGPAEYFRMRVDNRDVLRVTFSSVIGPITELKKTLDGRNHLDLIHPLGFANLDWYFVHVRLSKSASLQLHLNLHTESATHDLSYFPDFNSLSLEFCAESGETLKKCAM